MSAVRQTVAGRKADTGLRAEQAREAIRNCLLCPRACGVDRTAGEKGFCGLTDAARCFREVLYFQEESELVPSHQVFFSGCNLRCEFCAVQEWNTQPDAAAVVDLPALVRCVRRRMRQGARNLNLLGGEPTVSLFGILQLLARVPREAVVLWNSNMYFSDSAARLLDGVVDIYLADFKCGNEHCAERILGARDYVEVVAGNLLFARLTAGLIVRHVVLPGHAKCCLEPVLRWVKENMPEARLSLRREYTPPADAMNAPAEYLTETDYGAAIERARELDLNLIE